MAKGNGQRLKALYILKILQENSDEKHLLKTQQIIDRLEGYGIPAERKSVYADISALKELGYEIVCVRARANGGYYLKNRSFELPELKLLTDAVQASRLITVKKSRQLISKLETLASPFEAKQLNRQVYVSDRNKTDNETIYETIDRLHESMQKNRQVRFQYLEWTADGKKKCRHSGAFYEGSPYFLIWRDENYYLVAYDAKAQIMKHYRVDKIQALSVSEHDREGTEVAAKVNPAVYTEEKFGMFAGNEEIVTLRYDQSIAGVLFDRFGQAVSVRKLADGNYTMRVRLSLSQQFYGWLTGLGAEIEIVAPAYVRDEYKAYIQGILHVYQEKERSK